MPKFLDDSGICQQTGRLLAQEHNKKTQKSPPDLRAQTSALEIEGTEGAGDTGVLRALGERAQRGRGTVLVRSTRKRPAACTRSLCIPRIPIRDSPRVAWVLISNSTAPPAGILGTARPAARPAHNPQSRPRRWEVGAEEHAGAGSHIR